VCSLGCMHIHLRTVNPVTGSAGAEYTGHDLTPRGGVCACYVPCAGY
jgi:hypothetical protein